VTEESLFQEALSRSPAERAAFLEQACAGHPDLRAAVEALLAAHEKPGNILDKLPADLGQTVDSNPVQAPAMVTGEYTPEPGNPVSQAHTSLYQPPIAAGTVVAGRYTLVEQIGEGGMGEVWVAKQTEPVKRKVALKVIKAGMDSKAVLQRFEQERQALAMMDHPNIAKVLDGGLTADRRPFFAMELVNGLPLTKFCDEAKLGIRERLELFTPICQAVQHAHQKGLIHRDLKPSNILVTIIDGKPLPKVIDFGVAKATSGRLTDESLSTQFGAVVGTIEYMAPEQAGFSGVDIDTRADIYSLGVILYELLTGLRPLDGNRLKQAAYSEMIRIIQEEEPSKPSTRLSTDKSLPSLAAVRQMEPKKLMALLRGELDWVVMKCLEKQRDRRYETASGLARDIQRYLANEPVEARPPSAGYRLKKFVTRHKGQVIAASLVLLALLAGMAGTTWGLFEAKHQEGLANDRAEGERLATIEAKKQEQIARDETIEKEKARSAEAERGKELDKANDELKHRLGISSMLLANAAYDNRDVKLAAERLDNVPVEQRGWDWRYLKQQTRGGLFTIYEHGGPVTCVSFSPDGTRILSAGGDQHQLGEAKVWDARTGARLLDLKGLPQVLGVNTPVTNVAFSSDGTRIITAGEGKIARVCDARTGKLLLELKGHTTRLISMAFSPDGTRIVTGGDSQPRVLQVGRILGVQGPGEVKVWDARTGKELFELKGHTGDVSNVSFSPDGARIVTVGGDLGMPDEMKVWDAVKGGPALLELKGSMGTYRGASFSPDSTRIVTYSFDGIATVLDARTGAILLELKRTRAAQDSVIISQGFMSASFSPDGTRIVTSGGFSGSGEATVWDARTGAHLVDLEGHTGLVMSAAFSPDSTRIVTGSADGTIKTWDARTGTPRLELGWRKGDVNCSSISPDGTRIVTGGGEFRKPGEATVWDARTGAVLVELKGFKGAVKCTAFSPDGTRIVTGGGELENPGEATVWDAQTGTALVQLKGIKENVHSVSFSPDGARIVTGEGHEDKSGGVKVWDARTGAVVLDLSEEAPEFFTAGWKGDNVAFSPDGTRIVVGGFRNKRSSGSEAKVIDAQTGKTLVELKGQRGVMHCVAFSQDGTRILTGGSDRTVMVWDAQTGKPLPVELKGHAGDINSVAFSPDGNRIVSGSADRTVRVWDTRTGTVLVVLKGHTGGVTSVGFTPDSTRIITAGRGEAGKRGEAFIWDARTVPTPLELKGHTQYIARVKFSPDSSRIATASQDGTVKLWDTRTGTVLHNLIGHKGNVQDVAFSPDGTRLVTSGDSTGGKVWDARSGTALFDLKGSPATVLGMAFSPDGARIVTGGYTTGKPNVEQGVATVWDAQTGAALFDLKGHSGGVHLVAFTPDASRIVTHSWHGEAKVWDAGTGKELLNEPIPITLEQSPVSPGGRLFARKEGKRVELISLKLDAEEIEYRSLHSRPNVVRYREDYLAARTAKDDFAAGFYFNLLSPADRKAAEAEADASLFATMFNLADAHVQAGKQHEAATVFAELWNLKKAKLGPEDPGTLDTMNRLGVVYWQLDQFDKSVPLFKELFKIREKMLGPNDEMTILTVANLGVNLKDAGQIREAIPLLEKAHEAIKKDSELAWVTGKLIEAYTKAGERDKVANLLQKQLDTKKTALGPDHPQTLKSMNELGVFYWQLRQFNKAIPVFEELVKLQEAKLGRDHPETLHSLANLGVNYKDSGQLKEAIPILEEAHRATKKHPDLLFVSGNLVEVYAQAGETDKVVHFVQDHLPVVRKALPKDSAELAQQLAMLALSLLQVKAYTEAEPLTRECLTIREKVWPDAWQTFNSKAQLGGALLGRKEYADAEPLLLASYDGMKQREKTIHPAGRPRLIEALDRLVQLYTETNKPDEAKKWRTERAKYPDVRPKSPEMK
jgi:WD40 repeat protein/serine/threonine protein kinase/tetratricopeptide (TPR) repeat protein